MVGARGMASSVTWQRRIKFIRKWGPATGFVGFEMGFSELKVFFRGPRPLSTTVTCEPNARPLTRILFGVHIWRVIVAIFNGTSGDPELDSCDTTTGRATRFVTCGFSFLWRKCGLDVNYRKSQRASVVLENPYESVIRGLSF